MKYNYFLILGGILSLIASLLHIGCIIFGPKWYIFFGAGEKMAQMAARGDIYPTIITSFIAAVLFFWALYGFAGAGLIPKLPFMKFCLCGISLVYLIRGLLPFIIMPFFPHITGLFWLISSLIVLIYGILYAIGTYQVWKSI